MKKVFLFLLICEISLAQLNTNISQVNPTAEELLNRCSETLDKTFTSFVTKAKTTVHESQKFSGNKAYLSGERDKFYLSEFRTDGKRIKNIRQSWGDYFSGGKKLFRPENERGYSSDTYDGKIRYDYARGHDNLGRLTVFNKNPEETLISHEHQLAYGNKVSTSFGYLIGDVERFDLILKKANPSKMSVKQEEFNGTIHYVIDAETVRGSYKIWLNPENGYNFSKATVIRKTGNLFMHDYKIPANTVRRTETENIEFKQIDDLWVPSKTKSKIDDSLPGNNYVRTDIETELISMLINPDHDDLNSFSIDDIKDGVKARVFRMPARYIWKNGKLVGDVDKAVIN